MNRKLIRAVALASAFAAPLSTAYAEDDESKKPEKSQLIAEDDKKPESTQLIAQEDKKEKKSESQLFST